MDFDDQEREEVFREVRAELEPLLVADDPGVRPAIRAALRG